MDNNRRSRNHADVTGMAVVAASLAIFFCGCTSPGSTRFAAGDFSSTELELREAVWNTWRELIAPTSDELAFERIAWHPSFGEGLQRASIEQKPLLLWVMNGHPLGRT